MVAFHFAEYACRLALALAAQRHQVQLLVQDNNFAADVDESMRRRVAQRTSLVVVPDRRPRDPRMLQAVWQIATAVTTFVPDVMHVQESILDYGALSLFWLRRRFPMVLTVHDAQPHSGRDRTLLEHWTAGRRRWFYAQSLRRRADRVIVHGQVIRSELAAVSPETAQRIDVIPLGVLGGERDAAGAGDFCAIDPVAPVTFMFFGRIEQYKGLGYLLDAADILASSGIRFRVIVAGRGPDLARHRARILSAPWADLIEGFIAAEEIPALFRRVHALVLPYVDASQSGVATIAFNHGRPVLATRTGSLPEMIRDGENGLLVAPRDAAGIAAAMQRLIQSPQERDLLARGALQFARTVLSWDRLAPLSVETYRRALASKPRSRMSPANHDA